MADSIPTYVCRRRRRCNKRGRYGSEPELVQLRLAVWSAFESRQLSENSHGALVRLTPYGRACLSIGAAFPSVQSSLP